ncbi:MAG: PD-(D/E)XK nuclease-like domain-containing protein [Candidatus Fonsibacter sp.]
MTKDEILEKLKDDQHYYGPFGQQFLSNSNVSTLLTNPLLLGASQEPNINFAIGGYFHTMILEPDKLEKYKVINATTRNTTKYKELSGGEICLLQHEVDKIELMRDKLMANKICKELIYGFNVDYETPGITSINNVMWKGKADILNHDEGLIIDLKTTSDISSFPYSAKKYNYDSQAYIYKKLFGYDLIFMAIDKQTNQIGIFDCSESFLKNGEDKVMRAIDAYTLFYKTEDFDPQQHLLTKTLN